MEFTYLAKNQKGEQNSGVISAENEKQAQTLATHRDTLLPRLISGQLRLPDAEALLEETL